MRGFQIAKKVAVSLNYNLLLKRLAILYLFVCIASLLITPAVAHYIHEEKITGEMSISDQLGEAEEPDTDEQKEEEETIRTKEQEDNQPESNVPVEPMDKGEALDQTESPADSDSDGQSENTDSNESRAEDQHTEGDPDEPNAANNLEEQVNDEEAP